MSIKTEEKKQAIKRHNDNQLVILSEAYKKWTRRKNHWMELQKRLDELAETDEVKEYLKLQKELDECGFGVDYSNLNVVEKALVAAFFQGTDEDTYVYMGSYYYPFYGNLDIEYRSLQARVDWCDGNVICNTEDEALEFENTHTIIHPPKDEMKDRLSYLEFFDNLRLKYYETLLESSKEDADEMIAQYVKKK